MSDKLNTYPLNRKAITERILQFFPDATPEESEDHDIGNALWMLERLSTFGDQGKIDRWIGCVQGVVHTLKKDEKKLFSWNELRELTRKDLAK